jgi:hypothetical protein
MKRTHKRLKSAAAGGRSSSKEFAFGGTYSVKEFV